MTVRDLAVRAFGVVSLGASVASVFWLRNSMDAPETQFSALRACLVFGAFATTLLGLRLLFGGERGTESTPDAENMAEE